MKTLSNLTIGNIADNKVEPKITPPIKIGKKTVTVPFGRRMRVSANGIYFESTTGGNVFISQSELWIMAASADSNLNAPS